MKQAFSVRLGIVAIAILGLPAVAQAGETPKTARLWLYGNATAVLSPQWSVTVNPGFRYEMSRSIGEAKGLYLGEFFGGPAYTVRSGPFTAKFSLWYYYQGFRLQGTGGKPTDTFSSHNTDFIPQFEYAITENFSMSFRTIVNNKWYSNAYRDSSKNWGYGLVMRNLLQAKYYVMPGKFGVNLGIEPFWGLKEDSEAAASAIGYWQSGINLLRFYAGTEWKVTKEFALLPAYVYEFQYDKKHPVNGTNHYLFLTAAYVFKAF